jgi:hypothetical protein
MQRKVLSIDEITADTPPRLNVAAALAFPGDWIGGLPSFGVFWSISFAERCG